MSLGLERDGQLRILAPPGTGQPQLERLVSARQDWLYGQLAEKRRLYRPARVREYVTGEGFWYAGRSYRLLVGEPGSGDGQLRWQTGRFHLERDQLAQGRSLFIHWYSERLVIWANEQLHRARSRLRVLPTTLDVRDLGHRWGACGPDGRVSLHWRVMLLPRRMAEYVLLHELVHLEHPHHRAAFWERLEVLLPDYAKRRTWLALNGADYDL